MGTPRGKLTKMALLRYALIGVTARLQSGGDEHQTTEALAKDHREIMRRIRLVKTAEERKHD